MIDTTTYRELYSGNSKEGYYAGILFLVWPFLSVVSAFRNYKKNWAKNVFWAFCTFYGFSFAIGNESSGSDIVEYVAQLKTLHQYSFTFQSAVQTFQESGEIDVLRTFIAITLSRVTDSQAILTGLYGFIFGYFLSRNLWFIIRRLEGRLQFATILMLLCLFLVNPIWNLNGFRMWTAAHIFIYGLLPFVLDRNKRKLWISAAAILVHFSFVVPVSVLFLYILLGNRMTIYFVFFIITFFIAEIDISKVNQLVETYVPEALAERTAGYRNESHVESFRNMEETDTRNWYVQIYGKGLSWTVFVFLFVSFLKRKVIFRNHPEWISLFAFTLIFYGVANLMSTVPSGGRFVTVANLGALSFIVLLVQSYRHEKIYKRLFYLTLPGLFLYIAVTLRIGLMSFSPTTFMGNPVIALFTAGENMSLNDFMRMILSLF